MAALTGTTSTITEFAGVYKVAVVQIDGATGTTNTLTIGEMGTVVGVVASLKEDQTVDCASITAKVDGTTTNQITVTEWEDDSVTACTQNALDAYVIAVGY